MKIKKRIKPLNLRKSILDFRNGLGIYKKVKFRTVKFFQIVTIDYETYYLGKPLSARQSERCTKAQTWNKGQLYYELTGDDLDLSAVTKELLRDGYIIYYK